MVDATRRTRFCCLFAKKPAMVYISSFGRFSIFWLKVGVGSLAAFRSGLLSPSPKAARPMGEDGKITVRVPPRSWCGMGCRPIVRSGSARGTRILSCLRRRPAAPGQRPGAFCCPARRRSLHAIKLPPSSLQTLGPRKDSAPLVERVVAQSDSSPIDANRRAGYSLRSSNEEVRDILLPAIRLALHS